jgi:F5/8 type C domain
LVLTLVWGPWSRTILGLTVRVSDLDRAIWILLLSGVGLMALSRRARGALSRRSDLVFYVAATVVLAVLCCGPVLRTGDSVVLEPMPYRWLLYLPGFDSVRVPTRFWMLGMLCLAVAAGISFARYGPSGRPTRRVIFAVAVAGILLDGWTRGIGMPDAPRQWPKVERRDQSAAVIELPLGPEWDAAATFRAMRHRRPVVNGVSGYDPPHYVPLMHGLDDHDPAVLVALSSFGALDVVVNGEADPSGGFARYAAAVAGEPAATDGPRRVYRIPGSSRSDVALGNILPIVGVSASSDGFEAATDGNLETEWHDYPRQMPDHWMALDLGSIRDVGGLTLSLGEWARDYPRHFAIDTSADGSAWDVVWQGRTAAIALVAAIDGPRQCAMRFAFASRPARFIRMRPLAEHKNLWRVAEVSVHAPGAHVPVSESPR